MTLLYSDPLFLRHETGAHPECTQRLRAIDDRLQESLLAERCHKGDAARLTVEEIAKVHSSVVIERARELCRAGGGYLEADTVVSRESFDVAATAAGTCAAAVDAVITGSQRNALCLVRPPGHHATPTESMGFCLFNNIALAARRAVDKHQLWRVLILDWDVHHGNGTQDIFYSDPAVTFVSIHRYGGGFYPGTGAAGETGTGPGLGHTVNIPVRLGISRQTYRQTLEAELQKVAARTRPELILISAGFDAHVLDPVGSLCLETEDFGWMTDAVVEIAKVHCGGKVVSCLEGGYNLEVLGEAVDMHLSRLLEAGAT